jgi:parallel beta-helix repeat protein
VNGIGLNNITINNNIIFNSCESIFIGSNYGVGTERNTNIIIKNNKIYNGGLMVGNKSWHLINSYDREGIGLQNIANSTIANNEITGGVEGGAIVHWTNEQTSGTTGNKFVKNYIHDILGYGIEPGGASDYASSSMTAYNIIVNCGNGGPQSRNGSVYGGIVLNARQDSSLTSQIYNNTIYGCDMGIYFYAAPDNYIIKNNVIYRNGAIHNNQQIYYENWGAAPTNIIMMNNLIYDPATSNTIYHYTTARTVSYMQSNDRGWVNNVISNPKFSGGTNTKPYPYFYLQSTSPGIDAGMDVGLSTDYAGGSVPQGTAPDIGAFEEKIQ